MTDCSHAFKDFLKQKRVIRIINGLPPLNSCRGLIGSLTLFTQPSLIIYNAVIATVSDHLALRSVGEGHRFPTRHSGDLLTPRHRLAVYEGEVTHDGIKMFNKLPFEIKNSKENIFERKIRKFLIDMEFFSVAEFLEAVATASLQYSISLLFCYRHIFYYFIALY